MRLRLVRWVFRRFVHQYWLIHAVAEGVFSAQVAIVTICLAALYFRPGWVDVFVVVAIGVSLNLLPVLVVALRSRGPHRRFLEWRADPDPSDADTI